MLRASTYVRPVEGTIGSRIRTSPSPRIGSTVRAGDTSSRGGTTNGARSSRTGGSWTGEAATRLGSTRSGSSDWYPSSSAGPSADGSGWPWLRCRSLVATTKPPRAITTTTPATIVMVRQWFTIHSVISPICGIRPFVRPSADLSGSNGGPDGHDTHAAMRTQWKLPSVRCHVALQALRFRCRRPQNHRIPWYARP